MSAPDFWWRTPGLKSMLLSPLSVLYGLAADRPFGKGIQPSVPVLCIGNFIVGGAGKTPLALHLADILIARGRKVAFLTRGYKGEEKGPYLVGPDDTARTVGDEALLLAERAPCVVSADRPAGLQFLLELQNPDLVIMDDGFQSAAIRPSMALLVVDAQRGLGNGYTLPAGPVRARLETQIAHASALCVMHDRNRPARGQTLGEERADIDRLARRFEALGKPVLSASLQADVQQTLKGRSVIAFSGIGYPDKFFRSLENNGVVVTDEVGFADHHLFTESDAERLLELSDRSQTLLVTTMKDAARLRDGAGALARLREKAQAIPHYLAFDDPPSVDRMLDKF